MYTVYMHNLAAGPQCIVYSLDPSSGAYSRVCYTSVYSAYSVYGLYYTVSFKL